MEQIYINKGQALYYEYDNASGSIANIIDNEPILFTITKYETFKQFHISFTLNGALIQIWAKKYDIRNIGKDE